MIEQDAAVAFPVEAQDPCSGKRPTLTASPSRLTRALTSMMNPARLPHRAWNHVEHASSAHFTRPPSCAWMSAERTHTQEHTHRGTQTHTYIHTQASSSASGPFSLPSTVPLDHMGEPRTPSLHTQHFLVAAIASTSPTAWPVESRDSDDTHMQHAPCNHLSDALNTHDGHTTHDTRHTCHGHGNRHHNTWDGGRQWLAGCTA